MLFTTGVSSLISFINSKIIFGSISSILFNFIIEVIGINEA